MRKRRFTNVIVAMLVVVGILSSSIEAQAKSFPDVPAGSWFAEYVDYVSNAGLMTDNDRGEFKPLNTFTRGEFATSLYRLSGSPNVQYRPYFPDVPDNVFYSKGIIWCSENGIMTGLDSGYFQPDVGITREQIATVLYRYSKFRGWNVTANGDLSIYPDASAVAPFAVEGMKFAIGHGIITGDQDKLNPRGTVNRAVAATILCRYDKYVVHVY